MKLDDFSICSDIHPEVIKTQNTYIVKNLNLPRQEINPKYLKSDCPYLNDVEFCLLNKNSVLILLDHPELHVCYDVRQGQKNQPIAIRTHFGWVHMSQRS